MLFLVNNRILVKDREKTYLTAGVSATGTALSVTSVDTNAWADNDWIIVGEIGSPNAEVLQVNGAVSDGTSLTVDRGGSSGARYAHSIGEPVYRINYNQIRFFHNSTDSTTGLTTLVTIEIQPDDFETRYEDTTNTTGFGFVAFYNSTSTTLSPYSDGIPYAGQNQTSLGKMIGKVRSLCNEQSTDFVTDEEIVDALNDKQRDVINERMWTFNEVERSTSSIANQFDYTIPSSIKTLHSVRMDTKPLVKLSEDMWERLHQDTDTSSDYATHIAIWNNTARLYPRLSDSATATTLDGGISASDTTITVASTTSFKRGDYFRFIIESEVIYATGSTSTTFTGCKRAQEGTTATTHVDTTAVTENDIVFTGQQVATDLADLNDETVVPEPLILCYGASADLCHGKLGKSPLGDRYDTKYVAGMRNLRDKFTLKLTSQYSRIKDPREVTSGVSSLRNPNEYPTGITTV